MHERALDLRIRVGVVRKSFFATAETELRIIGFSLNSITGAGGRAGGKRVWCKPGDTFQLTLDLDHSGAQLTLSTNGAPPVLCANKLPADWKGCIPAIAVCGGSSRTLLSVRDARPGDTLLQDWRFREVSELNTWNTKNLSSNIKFFESSHGHGIYNVAKDPLACNETVRAKIGFTSGVRFP